MRYAAKDINNLIEQIRSGQLPPAPSLSPEETAGAASMSDAEIDIDIIGNPGPDSLAGLERLAAALRFARLHYKPELAYAVGQPTGGPPPELPEGAREKHYRDPALPGLYIRLLNTGVASWVLQWKRLGRQEKITIGDVLVLDRLQAIKAAKELLAKMTLDLLDPHAAKRERMRANKVTWATQAPLCIEQKLRDGELRSSTADYWRLFLIRGYHFKPLAQSAARRDYKGADSNTARPYHPAIWSLSRRRCLRSPKVILQSGAFKTGKLPEGHHNPMTHINVPKRDDARDRVLTDDEIQLIWKTCEALEADAVRQLQSMAATGRKGGRKGGRPPTPDHARGGMLLFLTACRRGEIGDLQWSEVDLDNGELKIPPERTKTDFRIVQNPLSDLAVQILRRVERRPDMEHVFGRDRRNPASKAMGHLKLAIENHIKRTGGTPPQNWRLHDIRRTVRTQLAALGVSMDVAEAILGHVSHRGKVERTYNRYEYWPEKRQALARWEARLLAIVNGTAENIERPRFGKKIAVVGGEDAAAAQRSKDEECTDLPPLQAWMPSQQKKRETA